MKINERFVSVQGEGLNTGLPTIFIRISGCNLRCIYCDTTYSYHEGNEMSVNEIMQEIESYSIKRVCITGGEPLLQKDIHELLEKLRDYEVSIETNGSVDISDLPRDIMISMDIKCPSSGESEKMLIENIKYLKPADQTKFILKDNDDYMFAKRFISSHEVPNPIFTPVGGVDAKQLVEKIIKDKIEVRVGLQIHKIIWSPDQRGV